MFEAANKNAHQFVGDTLFVNQESSPGYDEENTHRNIIAGPAPRDSCTAVGETSVGERASDILAVGASRISGPRVQCDGESRNEVAVDGEISCTP